MTDAAAQLPAGQSASQLSENIGDVLASIRRLIAQDAADDALPPHSAMQMPPAQRGILAEAQGLSHRNERGSGAIATSPLQLGAAERVSETLPLRGPAAPEAARPDVPLPHAETRDSRLPPPSLSERVSLSSPARSSSMAAENAAGGAGSGHGFRSVEHAAASDGQLAGVKPTAAPDAEPPVAAADTRLRLSVGSAVTGGPASFPPAIDAATTISPVSDDHDIDRIEPAAMHHASINLASAEPKSSPVGATSAPQAAAQGADDTATIFREMIRDVVRQELRGDRASGLSDELRTLILREVAQALTGGRAAQ